METTQKYPHLTVDSNGIVRIEGSRYKVIHLASEHYYYGWTAEELLRQHPDLRPEEVYSAMTYFYDHHAAMVAEMQETAERIEQMRTPAPFSRDELLRRNAAKKPE